MATRTISNAKKKKNDEFYTQYVDIERELNAYIDYNPNVFKNKVIFLPCDDPEWSNFTKYFVLNFKKLGLKKLISTSYSAPDGPAADYYQPTLFETADPNFDPSKTHTHGKIFTMTSATYQHDEILKNLKWKYLKGNGDFRSDEVTKLRDESDVIITNPPFSLFREFLEWIMEGKKEFLIISNVNAVSYKEVFPLIQENKIWLGVSFGRDFQGFIVPKYYPLSGSEARVSKDGQRIVSTNNTIWLTNLDHGKRHQPLQLMTMSDNLRYSHHKKIKQRGKYVKYSNYDAIDVPYTDAIPSDYKGVMGVPITFLHKYDPDQFEIIDLSPHFYSIVERGLPKPPQLKIDGEKDPYARILIKFKSDEVK